MAAEIHLSASGTSWLQHLCMCIYIYTFTYIYTHMRIYINTYEYVCIYIVSYIHYMFLFRHVMNMRMCVYTCV